MKNKKAYWIFTISYYKDLEFVKETINLKNINHCWISNHGILSDYFVHYDLQKIIEKYWNVKNFLDHISINSDEGYNQNFWVSISDFKDTLTILYF